MVLERRNVFVPSWQVPVDVHLNEFSQPCDVLDFLLLKLQVSEEASHVETTFEGQRVALGCCREHSVINSNFTAFSFVTVVVHSNLTENFLVGGRFDGHNEGTEVSHVSEFLISFGVEVADLADVLFAFHLVFSSVRFTHATDHQGVGNNLKGLTVSFELDQVGHDQGGGL